jgi:hypothetical protein
VGGWRCPKAYGWDYLPPAPTSPAPQHQWRRVEMLSSADAEATRHWGLARVMRLLYAYLIGLAACFVSFSVANRPHGGHWNTLFAALLGVSATVANASGQRGMTVPIVFAAALLSLVFVLAEALRSRGFLAALGGVRPLGFACGRHMLVVPGPEHLSYSVRRAGAPDLPHSINVEHRTDLELRRSARGVPQVEDFH